MAALDSKTAIAPGINVSQPRDIKVQLMYLKDDALYSSVKPMQIVPDWADDERKTNVRLEAGPLEIVHDVRGAENKFSLDGNGFRYVKAPTAFAAWDSQPSIGTHYLPELESLLRREVDGCDEILFYDARIRQESDEGVRIQGLSYKPFARQVHTDNTESSVIAKIRSLTEIKADWYLSGRARIINIWRPIKHPVYDCGLTIADGAMIVEGDVLECDRVRRDTGTLWDTMGVVKHRPGFSWYYMSFQDETDVLLFKNYDSDKTVAARCCLHTAFDMPLAAVPPGTSTRESIEVRALVFTHPQGTREQGDCAPSLVHPIATALERSQLNLIHEGRSITDRIRSDIDEGHEVKDAMLLLCRQRIRHLEETTQQLRRENAKLRRLCETEDRELRHTQAELRRAELLIAAQGARPCMLDQQTQETRCIQHHRSGRDMSASSSSLVQSS